MPNAGSPPPRTASGSWSPPGAIHRGRAPGKMTVAGMGGRAAAMAMAAAAMAATTSVAPSTGAVGSYGATSVGATSVGATSVGTGATSVGTGATSVGTGATSVARLRVRFRFFMILSLRGRLPAVWFFSLTHRASIPMPEEYQTQTADVNTPNTIVVLASWSRIWT